MDIKIPVWLVDDGGQSSVPRQESRNESDFSAPSTLRTAQETTQSCPARGYLCCGTATEEVFTAGSVCSLGTFPSVPPTCRHMISLWDTCVDRKDIFPLEFLLPEDK